MKSTSQIWQTVTDFLTDKFPQYNVSRGYDITKYVEDLQDDSKPSLFVTLNGYTFSNVTVKSEVIENKYDFGLTLIYKSRSGTFEENDIVTDTVMPIMSQINHQWIDGNIYFETPECTAIADSDFVEQYGVICHTVIVRANYYCEIDKN